MKTLFLAVLMLIDYTPKLNSESVIKFKVVPVEIVLPAQLNIQIPANKLLPPLQIHKKLDLRFKPLQRKDLG